MEHFYYYYTCDKCGKSLADSGKMVSLILRDFDSDKDAKIYDLCPECAEEIERLITDHAGDAETGRKDKDDKVTACENKEPEKGAQSVTEDLNAAALRKAQRRYHIGYMEPVDFFSEMKGEGNEEGIE